MKKEINKIADELEEDVKEESRLMSLLRKFYLLIIALIMIFLLLVNTNLGYHLVSLFSGKIISSSVNSDFTFDLKFGGKVFFDETVFLQLQELYRENQKHEFKACLIGNKTGKDYFVNDIYIPKIYNQDVFSVTSEMCDSRTIISMHSHPPLSCIFSEQDITSYNLFRARNKDGIIALMCSETRMSFFGYENI